MRHSDVVRKMIVQKMSSRYYFLYRPKDRLDCDCRSTATRSCPDPGTAVVHVRFQVSSAADSSVSRLSVRRQRRQTQHATAAAAASAAERLMLLLLPPPPVLLRLLVLLYSEFGD